MHGRRKLNFGSRDWGKAAQSVALDLNLNRSLGELSDDELVALQGRYATLTTAAPALLEHLERGRGLLIYSPTMTTISGIDLICKCRSFQIPLLSGRGF